MLNYQDDATSVSGFFEFMTDGHDRSIDIVVKSFSNAKERDAEEWATLFAKADPGFKFLGVKMPPGSRTAIIEAEWQPAS